MKLFIGRLRKLLVVSIVTLTVPVVAFICSCDGLGLDTYWRSERYVLLAVDTKSQMNLAFALKNGSALGLVGPTIFSVGANEKYIVVKQHPVADKFASSFDRSVTNYFIVERNASSDFRERAKGVRGPLERDEFERFAVTLNLPPFTKSFRDLE